MLAFIVIAGFAPLLIGEIEAEDVPRLTIETGHPWRPPFGLDRVGAPVSAVIAFSPGRLLSKRYALTTLRKGKVIGHFALSMPVKAPFQDRFALNDGEDTVVLLTEPHETGKSVELTRIALPEIVAEAIARPDRVINPVDLGTILVPADWLLLGPGQTGVIDVVALSRRRDIKGARFSAWFESNPREKAGTALPLAEGRRALGQVKLPAVPSQGERDNLHVALISDDGKELWQKSIRVMIVRDPPKLPGFGATALKLRFDAPISVRDPHTGAFSTIKYEEGWDAKLKDMIVSFPNGSRYVFWRGSCYIPFWAGRHNTGLSYEWAEISTRLENAVDCVEPLMDKELRYGRVEIVESTAARVHVRWSYQSTDLLYHVWGDSAVEDYYFYPDGFGTRVLNLKSDPSTEYELSEFIILAPQEAYPFAILPSHLIDILFLDGKTQEVSFPSAGREKYPDRDMPALYRVRLNNDDALSAIYFNPNERKLPAVIFAPFSDRGEVVTPAYWGSHWPLARGNATGTRIDDRVHLTPSHNSLMSWATTKPAPLRSERVETLDALGRSRSMLVRRWAWLIGMSDAADDRLLAWARSFAKPPALDVRGARIDLDAYASERRALRLIIDDKDVSITLKPDVPCVNPVFELIHAPGGRLKVTVDGQALDPKRFAWDGRSLWLDVTFGAKVELKFEFVDPTCP